MVLEACKGGELQASEPFGFRAPGFRVWVWVSLEFRAAGFSLGARGLG